MEKTIFVLVGPKGSGKTYIGSTIQEKLGINFFRVEDVWLKVSSEKFSEEYVREGFSLVEKEIDKKLESTDQLIIESTAAHEHFKAFLANLRGKYKVKLIQISAPAELCLERTGSRDKSIHIPVSDEKVQEINRAAFSVDLPFDLAIDNTRASVDEIVEKFSSLL